MDQRRKGWEKGRVFVRLLCNVCCVICNWCCVIEGFVMGEIVGWRGVVYSAAFESASHQGQVVESLLVRRYTSRCRADVEDAFNVHVAPGKTVKFKRNASRLYVYVPEHLEESKSKTQLIQTVEQNESFYTARRELERPLRHLTLLQCRSQGGRFLES